jgi:peroxiredoxin
MPKSLRVPLILLGLSLALVLNAGAASAGQPIDFSLPTVDGGHLKLSDFRGRLVVMEFFASWCRPCKTAMAKLEKLHQRYKNRGLSVIAYSVDDGGLKKVKPFVARLGINYPVVIGSLREARRLDPVRHLPTTLVIDPKGNIVNRMVGGASMRNLENAVLAYMPKGAPGPPESAKVDRRQEGESRFMRVWAQDNQILQGYRGVYFHVLADVADLVAEQGLWLKLSMRPEAQVGSGLAPVSEAKPLFQRIDDSSRSHHILFVRCEQFPRAPLGGIYRIWVTILDQNQKPVEKSGEFIMHNPGCHTAQIR